MNFKFNSMKISILLGYNNKQLQIPRYQRDYSWEIKEVSEFVDDILSGLILNDSEIENSDYFFGTTLLAGDIDKSGGEIEVIDGQQRITTMTIFLSAIAKCFYNVKDEKLGDLVWKFIMGEDYDGNSYRILKNDTTNHYFEYLVQMKENCTKNPIDEEQDRIKAAYEYCTDILTERKVKQKLIEIHKDYGFEHIKYIDILKAIRKQLLDSDIICISTKDKNSSNLIFEILNGKGKKLESIDLIKNNIFEYLNTVEPTDHAYNTWNNIKFNLIDRDEKIEFQTFFRHYWISKYKKVKDDQLYSEFTKTIRPENYKNFLEDIENMSKLYIKIVCPTLNDYNNRKEYMYIIECLNYFNNYFNIKQIRVALLSLFDVRFNKKGTICNKEMISNKKFKEILVYLHQFHFAYNALCTKRSNALEVKYSNFAKKLNGAIDKDEAHKIIDELKINLNSIFPNYNEFEREFIKLEFSKKKNSSNMLSKYVLNNIEKYYSDEDISKQNGSIEHILPEDNTKQYSLNIGNLILLEENINRDSENKDLCEKIIEYKKSTFSYVLKFKEDYPYTTTFTEEIIRERAKAMAKDYYYNVLGQGNSEVSKNNIV